MIEQLESVFREGVENLLLRCRAKGLEFRPFVAIRTPQEQAKLWRQSRPKEIVDEKIKTLEAQGAGFLAKCVRDAGPQFGRWATNAPPGYSWHQYGLAVDCVLFSEGRFVWDGRDDGYEIYAQEAEGLGLTPGHRWKVRDSVHVQSSPARVSSRYSLIEIDKVMKEMFGG